VIHGRQQQRQFTGNDDLAHSVANVGTAVASSLAHLSVQQQQPQQQQQ